MATPKTVPNGDRLAADQLRPEHADYFHQLSPDSVVSLLESAREDVRSHRTQLYGTVAAAFVLPFATIAIQKTHFLLDSGGYYGKIALVAWFVGIGVMAIGFWFASPKLKIRLTNRPPSEDIEVLKLIERAVGDLPMGNELQKAINAEQKILRRLYKASNWFRMAIFLFAIGAGAEFLGFLLCNIHGHISK